MTQIKFHPKAFTIASVLAFHGWRKGSLSVSGAGGAWVVGYLHMANDNPIFGVGLITFYALGTLATKYKASKKSRFEFDPSTSDHPEPEPKSDHKPRSRSTSAGNRTFTQVISTSLPSLMMSLIYRFALTSEKNERVVKWVGGGLSGSGEGDGEVGGLWARGLVLGALGHLATCLGDTLSSELGILSSSPPYLLTTWSRVPRGTNGAISPLGTGASAVGGVVLGWVFWAVEGRYGRSLVVGGGGEGVEGGGEWVRWMVVGALAGLGGSLLDSILGSTLQKTYYDALMDKVWTRSPSVVEKRLSKVNHGKEEEKQPMTEEDDEMILRRDRDREREQDNVKKLHIVGGWKDVLTNSQVNLISSMMISLGSSWLAWTGKV